MRSSLLVTLLAFVHVLAVNVTIDDANRLWSYITAADLGGHLNWNAISPSLPCSTCLIVLDPTQVYNGTWHDASCSGCSASISFSGTSGTLYGIIPESIAPDYTLPNNYSFVLNGKDSGFTLFDRGVDYIYHSPLFSFASLDPLTTSTLTVYSWAGSLLLDYLVYDDGSSNVPSSTPSLTPTSGPSKTSFPVAAVVVPLCAVAVLLAIITFLLRRRNRPCQSSHPFLIMLHWLINTNRHHSRSARGALWNCSSKFDQYHSLLSDSNQPSAYRPPIKFYWRSAAPPIVSGTTRYSDI